ncbi:uncharacterized protein si:ch211-196i2.1 [Clupea harengus]|uniref:Uncharacterized protein si:ch211-196i2.1 n=1 Tax=Clupea harengus TaxID=7950 RepID=A0A8M1KUV4_CLUHA|nr:uncharacterized protein si:ch211-196i2.1 [Clupea harengus]
MRFLRLHSRRVEQRVTFSCPPGHRLGQTRREAKFMTDVSKQSYLATIQDCVPAMEVDSSPRESVLQFEDLDLLPLRDVAVSSHSGDLTQQFGFTIGPVCFS